MVIGEVSRPFASQKLHKRRRALLELRVDPGLRFNGPRRACCTARNKAGGDARGFCLPIPVRSMPSTGRFGNGWLTRAQRVGSRSLVLARKRVALRLGNSRRPLDQTGHERAAFVDLAFDATVRNTERGISRGAVVAAIEQQSVIAQASAAARCCRKLPIARSMAVISAYRSRSTSPCGRVTGPPVSFDVSLTWLAIFRGQVIVQGEIVGKTAVRFVRRAKPGNGQKRFSGLLRTCR